MRDPHPVEVIACEAVSAAVELDVRLMWVDEEVAVRRADRAVTARDVLLVNRRVNLDCVGYFAAMAAAFVRGFGRFRLGISHDLIRSRQEML